jgi:cytochrome c oxidase cbb3-type subunit 3
MDPDAVMVEPELRAFAVDKGKAVFRAHCAACHGADARGDRGGGVPDLADRDWLYGVGRVGEIEAVVLHGIRSHRPKAFALAVMPAFASPVPSATEKIAPLTPQDVRDVTEFLVYREGREADPAAAARGGVIFHDRGGCFDCHGQDARGDPAVGAPDLSDGIWLYGDGAREAIARSIEIGRAGVCPGGAGRLSAVQAREVSAYVQSLSPAGKRGAGR